MLQFDKPNFRIKTIDGRMKFAGTGLDSWFTLAKAKELREKGETIHEYSTITGEELWEIL